ncbi:MULTISPECIES: hypothetical protein [Mesorhizobium]|uniref:hypothetical protein n=1 Tax=Mesorhizobium TaxID=68287 RepID=UPI0007ED04C6|nr:MULTISPECIES: hypothetical protein [Mesorhizobium]PBB51862.1 hypothetical protein CK223_32875 [Mesorhizobium loti]QIA25233.1 transposase [Mesorhizobium sp. AA22]
MRDLIRAREAAVKDRTRKRQEIRSFLLRHGKIYPGLKTWGTRYLRWLHGLSFSFRSQQAVLQELILAESQCRERAARLEKAIEDGLLDWPLAPVVERLQALRGVKLICAAAAPWPSRPSRCSRAPTAVFSMIAINLAHD